MNRDCIELFAGAGGAAVGLERAGLAHKALIEQSAAACETLRAAGFPNVIEADVQTVDFQDLNGADFVWASPPCQRHSRAGNGTGFDGWPVTLSCIDTINPVAVMIENVIGAPIDSWRADLESRGYVTTAALLRASDYGVPQDRRRWFIIAAPARVILPAPSFYPTPANTVVPDGWLRVEAGGAIGRRTCHPAPTVTKAGNLYWYPENPGRRSDQNALGAGARKVSNIELAGLQGFPDGYPFVGTETERLSQIGNAVPPQLARIVAKALIEALEAM